ncbi:MAG TPA: hypothetical protein VE439_09280 [Anaerolineae bacterium]|nr:hypothetical protein [Anaerolineae bacterium]
MRYTRLLLIIFVGLVLVAGCSNQQTTKQDSKATKKPAKPAIDFKTLQLNDNPSDPNWVDTYITYAGYAHTSGYSSRFEHVKLLKPAQVDYVGKYGDTQFYVSKDETQTPPLWLWATTKTLDTGANKDAKFGFRRFVKIPQGKSQMLRSAASNSKFKLTFVMPKQSYTTGRRYVTYAVLTSTKSGDMPTIGPLFEVVVLDTSGNVVASQSSSLDPPAVRVVSRESGSVPLPEHTFVKVSIEFNKAGTYRVVCRTMEDRVQKVTDPTIQDALRDLAIEPIEITVK